LGIEKIMGTSRIAVVVASIGRADEVGDLLDALQEQTRAPDHIVLSVTQESDLPQAERREGAEVIMGSKGLPAQRNRGMELILKDYDYLVFFDDDYIPSKYVIEGLVDYFDANPGIVGAMGHMIADGIRGPGISRDEAFRLVSEYDQGGQREARVIEDKFGLYGCNMAYRVSAIEDVRFDENLPLYAWQEDNDFANQLLPRGRLVHTTAFAGVHRGVKGARTRGVKLGYSQIANPVYLMRKGTMRRGNVYYLMSRNIIANIVKTAKPEPWVDRWGRVKGNWLGIRHWITGSLKPNKILDL